MLFRLWLFLALKFFQKPIVRELARIEYGLANYCLKFARADGNRWQEQLAEHAAQEQRHGKMLAAIAAELSVKKGGIAQAQKVGPWLRSTQVEGISHRYTCVKRLLDGKRLDDYPLSERLAIICALEQFSFLFYREVAVVATWPLNQVALYIASDEIDHAICSARNAERDRIDYWKEKILKSIPYAFIDLCQLILKF